METKLKRERVAGEVRASIARAGKRPADVASQTGIARSTLSRKLSGEHSFTVDELLKIVDALGVQLSEFVPIQKRDVA